MDKKMHWWTRRRPAREIDRDVIILPQRHLIFVTNQKAACSTLKATLWRWYIQDPDYEFDVNQIHKKASSPFMSPSDFGFKRFMSNINSPEYRRICFVRNPYTRLLSSYLDKIKFGGKRQTTPYKRKLGFSSEDDVTFTAFIEGIASRSWYEADPHWRAQTEQLLWSGIRYDFVGRFEHFLQEIDRLAIECGVDVRGYLLSRFGHARHADRRLNDFYTEELQARVYEVYQADFDAFGYEKILPRPNSVEGAVENRSQPEVCGWILDPDNPERSRSVAIHVKGRSPELVNAERWRADIARWKGTEGRHGFLWPIPEGLAAVDDTRIDVFDAETGRPLRGSPLHLEGGQVVASGQRKT